jgi:hypothetical protein
MWVRCRKARLAAEQDWLQEAHPAPQKGKAVRRTSEMTEGFCFVISVTCLIVANTGLDDDDDDDYSYLYWYLSTRLHGVIPQKAVALISH